MCRNVLFILLVGRFLPLWSATADNSPESSIIVSNHLDFCSISGLEYKCSFHTSDQVTSHNVTTLQRVVVPYNLTLDQRDCLNLESASSLSLHPTCISKIKIWTSRNVSLFSEGYRKLREAGCKTSLEAWSSDFDLIQGGVDLLSLRERCVVEVLNATEGLGTVHITKSEVKSLALQVPEPGELAVHRSTIGDLSEVKVLGAFRMKHFSVQRIMTKGIFMDTQEKATLDTGTISEVKPEGVTIQAGKLKVRNVTLKNLEHEAFVVKGDIDFENCHLENVLPTSILLSKDNSTVTFKNVRLRSHFITNLELRWDAEMSPIYPIRMILKNTHHNPSGDSNLVDVISNVMKLTTHVLSSSSSSSSTEGGVYKMEWYWVVGAAVVFFFTGLTAGLLLRCPGGSGKPLLLSPITFSNLLANEARQNGPLAEGDTLTSSRVDYIRQESSQSTASFNYECFGSISRSTLREDVRTDPGVLDTDTQQIIKGCNNLIRCAPLEENHYSEVPSAGCAREEVIYEELEVLQSMESSYIDMSQNIC